MARERIDSLLVTRGLVESREKAKAVIMAGDVFVDGQVVDKPGKLIDPDSSLELAAAPKYVSRGGIKLEHALGEFAIDVSGYVCVDVGASTGGFTDCLLKNGAQRVYAVDVGYGQLDYRLRTDPRVIVMERTNVRYLESLPEPCDLGTVDVSFISLDKVMVRIRRLLKQTGQIVALVKPQFEAGRALVGRGGVVRDPRIHLDVLKRIGHWAEQNGFSVRGLTASPIKGPAGNREFFMLLGMPGESIDVDSGAEKVVFEDITQKV